MSEQSVSILVPDIGSPSVGAAIRLASLIEPHFPTEIVGPDMGSGVCSLYRGAYPVKAVVCPRLYRYPDFWRERTLLEQAVSGRVVIALKAYMDTVPLALRLRRKRTVRAVVYLDEWDGAVLSELTPQQRLMRWIKSAHHPLDDSYYPLVERMIAQADTVFSSTTFLQKKFGGHIIPMGVDTARFAPQPVEDVVALKRWLGLEAFRLIVFGGVVRPHKGVELILQALETLDDSSIRLLVAGPITDHLVALQQNPRWSRWLAVAGATDADPVGVNAEVHRNMPLYLDLADLIVLPLNDTPLAQSQMPIKLFEAMAMGKPIIGSAVADLPLMLAGCGWVVPSGDVGALASQIKKTLADSVLAAEFGGKARARCVEQFSRRVVSDRLGIILKDLMT